MKIGIVTLPLRTNYGGILQAYALQTVLERAGHQVAVLDDSYRIGESLWKRPLSFLKRMAYRYVWRRKQEILFEQCYNCIHPFVDKYIHCVYLGGTLKEDDFDAFVVGSDQIWRPGYYPGKIENAYLNFTGDWKVKRVSYAASLGTDEWIYTSGQTKRCRALLQKFDAVSVREASGVQLCYNYFNVEVSHVLDPTMLLDVEDYLQLVRLADSPKSKGTLLCYILDETEGKSKLIAGIARDKGLIPFNVNSKVEEWLRGFYDAQFVVTDSFHACVFSILFHKPFVVVGNEGRGLTGIKSLLKMFGLEHRLFGESGSYCDSKEWDWCAVDKRLAELRKSSFNFLNKWLVNE